MNPDVMSQQRFGIWGHCECGVAVDGDIFKQEDDDLWVQPYVQGPLPYNAG
jgi:hypothetical protein